MISFKRSISNFLASVVFAGGLLTGFIFSNPSSAVGQNIGKVYSVADKMPEIKDGLSSLYKKIKYPEAARKAGVSGRVYIQFIVDENGSVIKPKVLKGIGSGCDKAALAAIKDIKFTPGIKNGQTVKVRYTLPVAFRLQN